MESAGCPGRIKNGAQNLSANLRPSIVQLTKADEEPLTIKAEKKNESLPNVKKVNTGQPGETRHISWPKEPGIPIWDVRVAYSTGVEAEFYRGVDLYAHDLLVVSLLEDGTVSNLNAI